MLKQDLFGAHVDAIWQPETQQQLFNDLMQSYSRPGSLIDWSNRLENHPPYLGVLATLLDGEVSLADIDSLLEKEHWLLLLSQSASVEEANYILCDAQNPVSFQPSLGTLPSPEYASTLILKVGQLNSFAGQTQLKLQGPGVNGISECFVSGIDSRWLQQRNEWCAHFPLGVDCIMVDDQHILSLPRSTKLEILEKN